VIKIQGLLKELKRAYKTCNSEDVSVLIKKILKKNRNHNILIKKESN